ETEQRTAFANTVRLALRLDPLRPELLERRRQVVDGERDMAVAGAELVRATVVVVGQLELLLLSGNAEEVVRRLLLTVPDDVHVATELEPERLVERPALLGIGDSVHRVQIARHAGHRKREDGPIGPLRRERIAAKLLTWPCTSSFSRSRQCSQRSSP